MVARCTVVIVSLALLVPIAALGANLTESEAVEIAAKFCARVGAPADGHATAIFPAPNRYNFEPATHWQKRWRIKFDGGTDVEVVDQTGVVTLCFVLFGQDPESKAPTGPLFTYEQAVERANTVLAASGQTREIDILRPVATLVRNNDGTLDRDNTWTVHWDRLSQGIPYGHQGINIIFQADNGALHGMSVTFRTAPIDPLEFRVTSAQAGETAMRFAAGRVPPEFTPASIQAAIQPVSDFWTTANPDRPNRGVLRPAWVARFTSFETAYEVWVDIETGSVVGGLRSRVGAIRYPKDDGISFYAMELVRDLSFAREVRVYRRDKHGLWEKRPFTTVNDKSSPVVLTSIRGVAAKDSRAPKGFADMKLVVIGTRESTAEYAYNSADKLVGGKGTWVSVPVEFQNLVAQSASKKAAN